MQIYNFITIFKVFFIVPLCVNSIGSEHEQIIKWWNKISEQKPLKCKINPSYLQPLHPITRNLTNSWEFIRIINSRPCTEFDSGKNYWIHQFKGKKVNGRLEGPGKLKILKLAKYVHDENNDETCIHRIKFPNILKDIIEVVGTFVNGTLHGTAKLVLEDQNTVIANFENGTLHGKIIQVLKIGFT